MVYYCVSSNFILQVANFYMNLLTEKFNRHLAMLTVHFYPKLFSVGYQAVCCWTKDVFNSRLLIFPLHLRAHWCLATVKLSSYQISYYDPSEEQKSNMFTYLTRISCIHVS